MLSTFYHNKIIKYHTLQSIFRISAVVEQLNSPLQIVRGINKISYRDCILEKTACNFKSYDIDNRV